jgi:hypothetical protein
VHLRLKVLHRELTDLIDPQRVGDRALRLLWAPRNPVTLAQGVPGVRGEFRLDADNPGAPACSRNCRGYAGDEAAAADRTNNQVDVRAIGSNLLADRSLTCNDCSVFIWRYRCVTVHRDQLRYDRHSVRKAWFAGHNVRAL